MKIKIILKKLKENEDNLFIIHYSCENLNDNNDNYSPRITSIAVLHVGSSTMHSFSIHLLAEEKGILRSTIHEHYDDLERAMLRKFFGFVNDHTDALWLHWNMTNINYGFEALSHRYKVLTQTPTKSTPDSKKYNLSELISLRYGKNCVQHPKMKNLMILNDGVHRDILSGKEEVTAFAEKEYIKLHKSTMCKAYWFKNMYVQLQKNKVKITNKNWSYRLSKIVDSLAAKILALIVVIVTLVQYFH